MILSLGWGKNTQEKKEWLTSKDSGYQKVVLSFLGNNTKKTIMAYGMKYTKGGFPFKASPATYEKNPQALVNRKAQEKYDSEQT